METLSLLDLIEHTHRDHQHRQLQDELPAELKGWELFFQRLGGVNRYYCINFDHNIVRLSSRRSHRRTPAQTASRDRSLRLFNLI